MNDTYIVEMRLGGSWSEVTRFPAELTAIAFAESKALEEQLRGPREGRAIFRVVKLVKEC